MSVVSSVRWVALSQAARVASQLLSLAVLARMLPPQAYGLMAMAMTVTNFAFLFRDLGTMVAIIQRKDLSPALCSSLYWLNVALACLIALVLAVCAGPIAHAYGEARLAPIVLMLALAFPLSSLAAVQQALMERNAQFRTLARIEVCSALGGLAAALLLALHQASVWCLVAQMLVGTSLTMLQALHANPWRPRKLFVARELKTILGFSGHFSLFQFVSYLERNVDSIIIGSALGSSALGIYAMATKVILFPLQNITGVASRALLPAMSRRQDSREAMGQLYLRATRSIAMVAAPLMAGLFFLREPFVALLLGARWSPMVVLLKWLAVVGFIQAVTASTGAVFLALGKSRLMLQLGLLDASLQVSAFLIGVHWGMEGVAIGYCAASLLNLLPAILFVLALLHIAPRQASVEIGKPVAATALMLLFLSLSRPFIDAIALAPMHAFMLNIGAGALVYAFCLLVLLGQDMSDMRALLKFQ